MLLAQNPQPAKVMPGLRLAESAPAVNCHAGFPLWFHLFAGVAALIGAAQTLLSKL